MPWENLADDIAEELSDQRLDRRNGGYRTVRYSVVRGTVRKCACGREFVATRDGHVQHNTNCRYSLERNARRKARRESNPGTCYCGKTFLQSSGSPRQYCSRRCNSRARYHRLYAVKASHAAG